MKRSVWQLLALAVVLVLSMGTGAWAQEEMEDEEYCVKILVPDFALVTAQGETVRLSDLRGQVVVLNFWATWCPYCVMELPELQELHEELQESGEAVIYLVDQIDGQYETPERATAFLEEKGITIPNLLDFGTVGNGIFQVPGLPTTVVIDAEGYLCDYAIGMVTKDVVRRMIEVAK
ncbi:MAG TPA: TlpA disulfide reductase family protein [Limnochordia bacterium]|nr:TlpA disulfide reductase family protein [Limnochordia bacterium]